MPKIAGVIEEFLLVEKPDYQKFLYIIPPRIKIPSHRHSGVRVNITFLDGQMIFFKGDRQLELFSPADSGRSFIIEPDEWHGAYTVGQCGIFITEQYKLTDKTLISPALNWEGDPINAEHAKQI